MIAAILRIIAADTIDPYASFNASFIFAYRGDTVLPVKHVRSGSKIECITTMLLKSLAKPTKSLSQSQNAKLCALIYSHFSQPLLREVSRFS